MKRKVWRSGNSWVITIPSDLVEKLNLFERKLIDFDIKDVFENTEKMIGNMFKEDGFFGIDEHFKKFPEKNSFNKDMTENGEENFRNLQNRIRQPLADLKETEQSFIVQLEIPGAEKKDIQLNITDNVLEVKVEKKSEVNISNEDEGFIRSERVFSGFYRSINLPSKVISEKARASYKNGILEVVMPKAEKIKGNAKRIEIE